MKWVSQGALVIKYLTAKAGEVRCRFNSWVVKIPWKKAWQSTPVFLPGESQGQRNQAGYNPWGHNESDMTEET